MPMDDPAGMRRAAAHAVSDAPPLRIGSIELASRLLLGSAGYPSPAALASAISASGAQVVTAGLRRAAGGDLQTAREGRALDALLTACEANGARLLPNT